MLRRIKSHDLILLGQGPSMEGCQFDRETWAAVSVLSKEGWEDKPYSRVFCFDDPTKKPDEVRGLEIAKERKIPIYGNPTVATAVYPFRKMVRHFGANYFLSDMSHMIALSIYEGYKRLYLWGVDQGPEYIYKVGKPYTTFWLGVATGRGVEWQMSTGSLLWLCRSHISGVE